MDTKHLEDPNKKEDTDSGVDNTSESGHSADEDHPAISSDFEELNSDNETTSIKPTIKGNENQFPERFPEPTIKGNENQFPERFDEPTKGYKNDFDSVIIKDPVKVNDVRIELNNPERLINDEYIEVLNFYRNLAESQCETVDFSISTASEKPNWFDEEKFKRGQKFARDHLFCINFAEMLSLFILFAQKSSLGPLIFTGKSDSPFKAFKRYLNTLTKLMSWYEDDVWNETESLGSRNLITVRGMHKNVYHRLTNCPAEDLAQKTTLGDPRTTAMWCPLKDLIAEDFRESLPPQHDEVNQFEENLSVKKVWVNQADMSMTQFGFVGLAVTYPEYFGIHLASDEDLDAFLHLWRGLGYLLGIKDKYNYCNSSLEAVRMRTKFFLEVVAKPAFRNVTYDWEHMCRCLTAGISYYLPMVNFESSLLYLCNTLQIETPRLKKQITFGGYIVFHMYKITFYLMKFRGVLHWLNFRMHEVIKKVQKAPPEVISKWESKEFSYMKQSGKCPIRSYCPSQDL